jgi:ribosomal protein S6
MNYYELAYLIPAETPEENRREIFEKIKSRIQKYSGLFDRKTLPEKKSLAYLSKKQAKACLTALNFYLKKEKVAGLLKELKSENQIIRYMLVNKNLRKEKDSEKRKVNEFQYLSKQEQNKKADLKDIDKKIDEILKE